MKRLFGWPSVFVLASSLMALSIGTSVWFRESERKEERSAPTGNSSSPLAELKAALPYLTVFIIYMSVYAQSSGALLLFVDAPDRDVQRRRLEGRRERPEDDDRGDAGGIRPGLRRRGSTGARVQGRGLAAELSGRETRSSSRMAPSPWNYLLDRDRRT